MHLGRAENAVAEAPQCAAGADYPGLPRPVLRVLIFVKKYFSNDKNNKFSMFEKHYSIRN